MRTTKWRHEPEGHCTICNMSWKCGTH